VAATLIPPEINQFVFVSMVWFFLIFGGVGFAVGVGLILDNVRMHQFFGIMNRWVSLRPSTKWLAIPRDAGMGAQRFRRVLGAAFVLIAAYSTFVLITQVDTGTIATMLRVDTPRVFVIWMIESVRWFLIAGGIVAIAVGIMLTLFQEGLRAIETRANHWYSFRSYSQSGEAMHMGFDRWVENYPRAMGWIIAVAALVVIIDCGERLVARS
jgi:hypothetical protein